MLVHLARRYLRETVPVMEKQVNWRATARHWGLKPETASQTLRLDRNFFSLVRFAVSRKPVYDQIPVLQRVSANSESRPPLRIFVRIDDVFFGDKNVFDTFAACMGELQIPFLAAVTAKDLMSAGAPESVRMLAGAKAAIGIHGFEHSGRFGCFASEVLQMSLSQIGERLSETLAKTRSRAISPIAFVAPFNAINAIQIRHVAKYLPIVCAGPETARFTERLTGPLVLLSEGVYFPSFHPFYSSSTVVCQVLQKHTDWLFGDICITLHMDQEHRDGFGGLKRLAQAAAASVRPWEQLLPQARRGA
jgi:hypothetical protein